MAMTHEKISAALLYSYSRPIHYEPLTLDYLTKEYQISFPKSHKPPEGYNTQTPIYVPTILCLTTTLPYKPPIDELFRAFTNVISLHLSTKYMMNKLYSFTELVAHLVFTLSIEKPLPHTSMVLDIHDVKINMKEEILYKIPHENDITVGVSIYIYIYIYTVDHRRQNRLNNANKVMGRSPIRDEDYPICTRLQRIFHVHACPP